MKVINSAVFCWKREWSVVFSRGVCYNFRDVALCLLGKERGISAYSFSEYVFSFYGD